MLPIAFLCSDLQQYMQINDRFFFSLLKGMLLRYFVNFYDMEIIEEEAFLAWKEDITQEFPGKGKALFQVQAFGACYNTKAHFLNKLPFKWHEENFLKPGLDKID